MVLCSGEWSPLQIGNMTVTFDNLLCALELSRPQLTGYNFMNNDSMELPERPMLSPLQAAQRLNMDSSVNADGTIDIEQELRQLLVVTIGLSNMRDLSRTAIFTLGQQRVCI